MDFFSQPRSYSMFQNVEQLEQIARRARAVAEHGAREAVIFEIEAVIAMQAHDYLSLNTAATFAGTFYASARIRSA
jgi:hypothetical protein